MTLVRTLALAALALFAGCGGGSNGGRRDTPTPTTTITATPTSTATPTTTATVTPTATEFIPASDLSGGDTTVHDVSRNAFAFPAANLDGERLSDFFVGNSFFNRNWVTAPASTSGLDGLGPVFNARSCSACHFKDGRGAPPQGPEDNSPSLLFRLSVPGSDGSPHADVVYGDQLQPQGILGVAGEGRVEISYVDVGGTFSDGTPYVLRQPVYSFADLAFGPIDARVMVSPRVAPAMIGLGLLEAVPEQTLLDIAAEQANAGMVSGAPNYVWDVRLQQTALGRFGWKANQPTLEQQSAGAFLGDIGLTSELFPEGNCTAAQAACLAAPNGGEPELEANKLHFISFYSHLLAVPARRDIDNPLVQQGKALFASAGCAACHVPTLDTGELDGFPEVSNQRIHAYTDLLLHDMGEGLADGRPDFLAGGREWRTPPLWGIGLVQVVNRHDNFLHDGRARGLMEAILWHGGEAEAAREAVRAMSVAEREALVQFLGSL